MEVLMFHQKNEKDEFFTVLEKQCTQIDGHHSTYSLSSENQQKVWQNFVKDNNNWITIKGTFNVSAQETTMRAKWYNHQPSKDKDDYIKRDPVLSNFISFKTDRGFRDV